jgi:hypothetical protein
LTPTDLVIACWTGPDRTEIWHESEHLWLALTPGRTGFNTVRPHAEILSGIDSKQPIQDHDHYMEYLRQWCLFNTGAPGGRWNKIKNILAPKHPGTDMRPQSH